jgi:hypothetical protein
MNPALYMSTFRIIVEFNSAFEVISDRILRDSYIVNFFTREPE